MQAKQIIISELENLSPNQLGLIHGLIQSWKNDTTQAKLTHEEQKQIGHRSRITLGSIKDSLSDDIIRNREEKI